MSTSTRLARAAAVAAIAALALAGCTPADEPAPSPTATRTPSPTATATPTETAEPSPTETPVPTAEATTCENVLDDETNASLAADGVTLGDEVVSYWPALDRIMTEGGFACQWNSPNGDVSVWYGQLDLDSAGWGTERDALLAEGYTQTDDPFPGTLQAPDTDPNYMPSIAYVDGTMYFATYAAFFSSVRSLQ
ncbi:hypothetical protein MN032_02955 [Agromyces atrinae]|uniref:hypothetical protein n=1 Tax=Agromyces atrinae TaxID=592376 RepID=UPI001F565888|nr:hypothetical protein [Agromyces atrinae]MCI2956642.1 hypothetical protein [Agromyces atrinae]